MKIVELLSLTDKHIVELKEVFAELSPNIHVITDTLVRAIENPGTHVFALLDDDGRIIGTATLCVMALPTGSAAHVEAVVVKKECRGQHLGRMLMEHIIDYAHHEVPGITVHLTSNPNRVAANEMYKRLGFVQVETNVYRMKV